MLNQNDLISIIIPMYNAERYILRTVKSVLNQTYKNTEIIILDNCSDDASCEIVSTISDSRICLIRNETNIGLNGSLNKGISLSKGKYIKFLCADDELEPECLEKMYLWATERNIKIEYSNCKFIDENDNRIYDRAGSKKSYLLKYNEENVKSLLLGKIRVMPCVTSLFIRNDELPKFRLVNESGYHSDFLFLFDCFKKFGHLAYFSDELTRIRRHTQQGTYNNLNIDIFQGPLAFGEEICRANRVQLSRGEKIRYKFRVYRNGRSAFIRQHKKMPSNVTGYTSKYFGIGYSVALSLYVLFVFIPRKIMNKIKSIFHHQGKG